MGQFKIKNSNSESTTSGDYITLPKLTTTERDALVGVETGALINNTTTNTIQLFGGSNWETIAKLSDIPNATTITTINSNTSVSYGVVYLVDTSLNNIDITLPTVIGNIGKEISIKNIGNNVINIISGQTIDGYISFALKYKNSQITLFSNGTDFNIK